MKKVLLVLAVAAIGMVACKKEANVKPVNAVSISGGKGNLGEMD